MQIKRYKGDKGPHRNHGSVFLLDTYSISYFLDAIRFITQYLLFEFKYNSSNFKYDYLYKCIFKTLTY